MFPLITWKEQAICLQKLQAVVITLSLLNFPEEYLMVKRTLTTLILRALRKRCFILSCKSPGARAVLNNPEDRKCLTIDFDRLKHPLVG